jgi:hypothetical protein
MTYFAQKRIFNLPQKSDLGQVKETWQLPLFQSRFRGLMDKASASEAGDCGFKSHREYTYTFRKQNKYGIQYRNGEEPVKQPYAGDPVTGHRKQPKRFNV